MASGLRSLFLDLSSQMLIAPATVTLAISRQALAHILDIEIERAEDQLRCTRPFRIRKRGSETKVLIGDLDRRDPNPAMIDLIAKGHTWALTFFGGKAASVHELARRLGVDRTLLNRALPLSPAGSGNHHPDGNQANHALTFKLDLLGGADQAIH